MTTIAFTLNGEPASYSGDADKPLLWALREDLRLTGTKFGCGIGLCGACTVHLDGVAARSCSVAIGDVEGKQVKTIEGMAAGGTLHPVQQAWLEIDVPQCGFCQPGQIMAAAAMLRRMPAATDADIDAEMTNICRCGTYGKIRAAIRRSQALLARATNP